MRDVPVIIAGGGPVGLTLAMDLGWRGVPSLLFEERIAAEPPNPKCNTTNARSMEHFRRLGCADHLRAAGLPADHPTNVVYVTRLNGYLLGQLNLPASSTPAFKLAAQATRNAPRRPFRRPADRERSAGFVAWSYSLR